MTTSATIPWNLVTKNLHGNELLQKKLREKITKLEKIREFLQQHYSRLVRHARRQIRHDEIAMVTGQSLRKVQENLASVQRRLREAMLEEAVV